MFNSAEKRKPGFKLALFGTVLAVFVLGLGAFTRLADAGLGCPDWPGCYGHMFWPDTATEVEKANQLFPDTPVEHDKTWPEMVHRYFASALGLISIILVALAFKYRSPEQPFKLPLFMLGFIILQGMFGMWTVTLKLWPQIVTAHLLGGFTTFSLYWLLTLRLSNNPWQLPKDVYQKVTALKKWALLGLIIVACQVALGGWTTSNYAAVACPDLPTCQNQWLPAMNFSQGFDIFQAIGPNYLGGTMDNESRIAIHFSHRIGAIITSVYLIILAMMMLRLGPRSPTQRMAKIVIIMLSLQVLLGLGNIIFKFPLAIAVAHNLGGALLLLVMVTLNYQVQTSRSQ
ncbi:COX15/CtaA family protein [Dasania sp. GY-MA-18]|uniref:COX15/CtaA family protein n=1 Tax=Dasania phycosphaerae TaxID=2950436 RepID=A0A9J6RP34_9GAMM|nr:MULTISPECIES: COX15/CtaA family protein [Dasania]MCR8923842.1 COX15/CtaA family protein [Dasania sp. GY-MA-18]MCZ0866276.1 COX15/CtaA family protein [Dasania phycosphaerae]MCZ0870000.1 COX15/CtaA family protein [Dasania phycosphaerae]